MVTAMRINIQIDSAFKREVEVHAERLGESVSAFFREGARARLAALKRAQLEERLVEAYQGLTDENRAVSEAHEPVDLEGWE